MLECTDGRPATPARLSDVASMAAPAEGDLSRHVDVCFGTVMFRDTDRHLPPTVAISRF